VPYTLEMVALTRMPARTFSTLMSIEPAAGALSGFLFLSEVLTLTQWLAIAAIITASIGTTLTAAQAPAATVAVD
jgi:inner membrane transporter RhtA